MTAPFFSNLLSWMTQAFVIVTIGAVLPFVFRIRHPKSHLAYCHLLLIATIVLPFIQPWQYAIVQYATVDTTIDVSSTSPSVQGTQAGIATILSWQYSILGILTIGIVARLCWLVAGLWQIHRYRTSAMPLHPFPNSIEAARAMTKADAVFSISSTGRGPVTFGFLRPVILLPDSFLQLDSSAQCAIACHELLHVRRKDWFVTVLEELIGSILWFHPGVWWLLAQARLAREQLVDAEVVRLTSAREPYINVLQIAGARPALDLAPAPLFLRRRHLTQRMHSLLTEVPMSKLRLVWCYASISAILTLAAWSVFVAFPLIGEARVAAQTQPGYVVNRVPSEYPREARERKIEGTVVVELTFNTKGEITDARVLSGPDELRKAALQSALQGNYGINVARSLQVVMDFKLSAPEPGARQNERRKLEIEKAAMLAAGKPVTDIRITGLSEPLRGELKQRLQIFQGQKMGEDLMKQIQASVRTVVSGEEFSFVAKPEGDHAVLLVAIGAAFPPPPPPPPPVKQDEQAKFNAGRMRVGGEFLKSNLIQQVPPVYPPVAKEAGIEGVVVLEVEINPEGRVEDVRVVTGRPELTQAAVDAVKQWVYKPTLMNGVPIEVVTTITVNFSISK